VEGLLLPLLVVNDPREVQRDWLLDGRERDGDSDGEAPEEDDCCRVDFLRM